MKLNQTSNADDRDSILHENCGSHGGEGSFVGLCKQGGGDQTTAIITLPPHGHTNVHHKARRTNDIGSRRRKPKGIGFVGRHGEVVHLIVEDNSSGGRHDLAAPRMIDLRKVGETQAAIWLISCVAILLFFAATTAAANGTQGHKTVVVTATAFPDASISDRCVVPCSRSVLTTLSK